MFKIEGYFEGRKQVLAYANGYSQAQFVANVFRSYLGGSWTIDTKQMSRQEVSNVAA